LAWVGRGWGGGAGVGGHEIESKTGQIMYAKCPYIVSFHLVRNRNVF
jgi:hypothetical protein